MVKSFINNIRNKLKNLAKADKKKESTPKSIPDIEIDVQKPAPRKASSQEPVPKKKRPRRRRKNKKSYAAPPPVIDFKALHKKWDISQFDILPAEGKTRFHDLNLPGEILHAVADMGFQYCSPIQAETLPGTLAGRDTSGQAQTGTGKTAAFLITMLNHFIQNPIPEENRIPGVPRALVLAPTRELVMQIAEEAELLCKYFPIEIVKVFGGMDYQKQRRQLTDNLLDIVVATPGRLIDYCEHNEVHLEAVEILVIDEADRMADMGFMPQVRRLVRRTPRRENRQTLFFSATMTGDVERLASQWTVEPIVVEIEPEHVEAESVEQVVYLVTGREKLALLYSIIARQDMKRVIIFCNRRTETHRVADLLRRYNIRCSVISGEIPQKKRVKTLENFRSGNIRVLIATDVAGRGLHIDGVSHVINYTLPHEPENYVHRIGRTGRAGASGTSISFACDEDSFYLPAIEEFLGHPLSCSQPEDEWLKLPEPPPKKKSRPPQKPRSRRPKSPRRDSRPRTPR